MRFLVLVFSFVCLLLTGCGGVLYSNLDEKEANEMLALLSACGITAGVMVSKEKASVTVPENQKAASINVLYAYGYPKNMFETIPTLFPSDSLIKSPLEEQARYNYAVSQEIASMINSIDGVISAKVHIIMPLKESRESSSVQRANDLSVSVMIKHSKLVNLKEKLTDIQLLVAKSIPRILSNNIGIVLFETDTPAVQGLNYKDFAGDIEIGYPYTSIIIIAVVFLLVFAGIVGFFYMNSRKPKKEEGEEGEEAAEAEAE